MKISLTKMKKEDGGYEKGKAGNYYRLIRIRSGY
jgi:hypothetical protein